MKGPNTAESGSGRGQTTPSQCETKTLFVSVKKKLPLTNLEQMKGQKPGCDNCK